MKKTYSLLAILSAVVLLSCKRKNESFDIVNLNNNEITILGHGGLGISGTAQYPMNSYEGISMAISLGADGAEMDVQMTKDSVLVAFHDSQTDAASNISGHIYDKNWSDIEGGILSKGPYTNYRIVTLDYIFSHIDSKNHNFTFDLKTNSPDKSPENRDIFQRALIRLIDKYELGDKVTIEHGDEDFLVALQAKSNKPKLFVYSDYDSALAIATRHGFAGITIEANEITAEQVNKAHQSGVMVAIFSLNFTNHVENIRKNVDIMQTDQIPDLVKLLRDEHQSFISTDPFK